MAYAGKSTDFFGLSVAFVTAFLVGLMNALRYSDINELLIQPLQRCRRCKQHAAYSKTVQRVIRKLLA